MNRKLVIIILGLLLIFMSGCSNTVIDNPEGIRLHLEEDILEYMPYEKLDIPDFIFGAEENFKTTANFPFTFQKILSSNDDFLVSEAIANLLMDYKNQSSFKIDNEHIQSKTRINARDPRTNKVKKHKLLVDNEYFESEGRKLRVVYDEVAFILLDNGLQLTIEYRRFTSDDITYYTWRYTKSLSIYLHFPLLVHETVDEKIELYILPLRQNTRYTVGPQLDIAKLTDSNRYANPEYYDFQYPAVDNKQTFMQEFYTQNHNGRFIKDDFVCTYLGIDFKIDFLENHYNISLY